MKYTTVLFDLDGTITDSKPGILNSIRYALKKHGLQVPSDEVLQTFIGPPLKEQFQEVFGLTEEESIQMVAAYREYYAEKGIFENRVYEGVPEMLEKLKNHGMRIVMATAKPELYAERIAEHFEFDRYFDFIGGACMDGRRTDKHEVIEYVLKTCGIKDRGSTVMVGDRRHDMEGAGQAGIASLGVLYGYGSRQELETAGAGMLAEDPAEAAELILSKK